MSQDSIDWREMMQDPGVLGVVARGLLQSVEREERGRFLNSQAREIGAADIGRLHDMSQARYGVGSFGELLKPLLKPSLRAVAERAGLSKSELHGLVSGTRPLTVEKIERVAEAVRVNPGYFEEYRDMTVAGKVNEVLRANPRTHLTVYKFVANHCK